MRSKVKSSTSRRICERATESEGRGAPEAEGEAFGPSCYSSWGFNSHALHVVYILCSIPKPSTASRTLKEYPSLSDEKSKEIYERKGGGGSRDEQRKSKEANVSASSPFRSSPDEVPGGEVEDSFSLSVPGDAAASDVSGRGVSMSQTNSHLCCTHPTREPEHSDYHSYV